MGELHVNTLLLLLVVNDHVEEVLGFGHERFLLLFLFQRELSEGIERIDFRSTRIFSIRSDLFLETPSLVCPQVLLLRILLLFTCRGLSL